MKKFTITAISLLIITVLAAVAFSDLVIPAWDNYPIIPGILTLQASNAEVGNFLDFIGRRSYSLVDTNILKIGKRLDFKLGVIGIDTPTPVTVGGLGIELESLFGTVGLFNKVITVDSDMLNGISLNALGGYDFQNKVWLAGTAFCKKFVFPNPF